MAKRTFIRSKIFSAWKWGNNPTKDEFASQRCAIISDNYSHSIDMILILVAQARKDFPSLSDKEIEVVTYGGQSINGILGIEFDPGSDYSKVPDSYDFREIEVHR